MLKSIVTYNQYEQNVHGYREWSDPAKVIAVSKSAASNHKKYAQILSI